jgi:hypothetical protein
MATIARTLRHQKETLTKTLHVDVPLCRRADVSTCQCANMPTLTLTLTEKQWWFSGSEQS